MKALVVINEQHSVLPEQERILLGAYGSYQRVNVPAEGWTLAQIKVQASILCDSGDVIVFASAVPALLKIIALEMGKADTACDSDGEFSSGIGARVKVFHNDVREKKELPGGKIIMVVSQDGWVLV